MSVQRNLDGQPTKLLVGSNHDRKQNNNMTVTNRVTGKGHGGSEEDESRNNEDVNRSPAELVVAQAILQSQKQQWQQQQPQLPQGSVVRWDNFLPVKSLKVLLVENDDSTRHIVSALLRNCSYEVTAVSNGLEAWKILEGLTNHIGLVLTEVAMPGLSGIDLLSKIMSHKTYKNIPVIMMSSNDSMKIVFKCLSSGAVDFLVKPIRKNELKNLWQHVWRKCHSSSGSGSESGIRTQKSPQSRSVDGSDNNTDSNGEEDNGSTGLIYRNGSDNDSGTQSSCSKRAVEEVHGPQMVSQWDDLSDPPDSTCAQVIYSRPEAQSTNWLPTHATRRFQIEDDETDDAAMGKDLTIEAPKNSDLQLRTPSGEALGKVSSTGTGLDMEMKKDTKRQGKSMVDHNSQTEKDELKLNDKDVIAAVTNVSIPCGGSAPNEILNDPPKVTKVKHRDAYDPKEPSLELSLQRLRDVGSSGTHSQERNVLRHSDHSAFSRYNNTSTSNQGQTGNVGSCSPVDYSLGVEKTESIQHLKCNSSGTPNQGSNESSNNNDMGSTTNKVSAKPESLKDNSVPRSTVSVHHYSFQQVEHNHSPSDQNMMPGVQDTKKIASNQAMAMHQQGQVEHHHHHHYHHHHHHVHSRQQQQQPLSSDELSSRNVIGEASHLGPSDKSEMGIEGNAANYGSGSGSNNGSNGQSGNSHAGMTEGTNVANDNGVPGACGTGSGSRSGIDEDRLALREAALKKFRQKRKERCFEKKVRYQSRKKLAEQRPRVRGQFVKQPVDENKTKDESNDTSS